MNQFVRVNLKKITYGGDDIGPNFHLKFSIEGQDTILVKRVDNKTSQDLSETVFKGFIHSAAVAIKLDVVEDDPIYDEEGSGQIEVSLSSDDRLKAFSIQMDIEGRGWEKGRQANLQFDFELSSEDGTRYASDADSKGWLKVLLSDGTETQIPYALKVQLEKIENGREYFVIQEGFLKGKNASVRLKRNGDSFLLDSVAHQSPARSIFKRNAEELTIQGLGVFRAKTHDLNPVVVGVHDLQIPWAPHKELGEHYLADSKYAQTWFRISREGDRFLHCGTQSAGCITVLETNRWTEIWNFLILCRKDEMCVGLIEVID